MSRKTVQLVHQRVGAATTAARRLAADRHRAVFVVHAPEVGWQVQGRRPGGQSHFVVRPNGQVLKVGHVVKAADLRQAVDDAVMKAHSVAAEPREPRGASGGHGGRWTRVPHPTLEVYQSPEGQRITIPPRDDEPPSPVPPGRHAAPRRATRPAPAAPATPAPVWAHPSSVRWTTTHGGHEWTITRNAAAGHYRLDRDGVRVSLFPSRVAAMAHVRTRAVVAAAVARPPAAAVTEEGDAPILKKPRPPAAMDVQSARVFTGESRVDADDEAKEAAQVLFGRDLTTEEWEQLASAPAGSDITLGANPNSSRRLYIYARNDQYDFTSSREIYRDLTTNELVLHNNLIVLADTAPAGLGTRLLARQVQVSRELGITNIWCSAERGDGAGGATVWTGYKVWPRLGYNGAIPWEVRRGLPPKLQSAREVMDLMATPEGQEWWDLHGTTFRADFDPAPGSLSSRILESKLAARGVKL